MILWSALSLIWTPFPGQATERLLNLVATILLTLAGYLALPDRMRSANLYLLPLGVTAAAIVAIMIGVFGDTLMRGSPEEDDALDRGLTLLALLVWPAVAWLRSRHRDREALATALLVAAALAVSPNSTQIVALAIGALAFALTSVRPRLGVAVTAGLSAAAAGAGAAPALRGAPDRRGPVRAGLAGRAVARRAWQKVVTTEPVRLVTGHGFETALRGRFVGLLPANAPTTMLFEFWYELGIVGALAAAFALYASVRRSGRDAPGPRARRDGGLRHRLHDRLRGRRPHGDVVAHDARHHGIWSSSRSSAGQFRSRRPRSACCGGCGNSPTPELDLGRRLDRRHVGVRQAEMVADLVDEDVGDEVAEGLVVLRPVIEERRAGRARPCWASGRSRLAGLRQPDASEQAEQVELGLACHLGQGLLVGKILDHDAHAGREPAKLLGELREGFERQFLDRREARGLGFGEARGLGLGEARDLGLGESRTGSPRVTGPRPRPGRRIPPERPRDRW